MFDRIAVIYRGHLRTWNFVKEANFFFFDKISKNVDYYFATWNLPYDHDSVKKDFESKNLIKYLVLPWESCEFYDPLRGPWWLGYNIVPYKRQREKEITYDAVFELRPDALLIKPNDDVISKLEEMTLYTQWMAELEGLDFNLNVIKETGISDIASMMPSNVSDILCYKYIFKDTHDPHINFKRFCNKENIKVVTHDNIFSSMLTRPNMINKLNVLNVLDADQNDTTHFINAGMYYFNEWNKLPNDEKIRIMNTHGILAEDYS